ncbi:MAG: beta-N-acetylhexosaminidase [Bacteroidales bacterium]|nr:beta-N-acetylhexosaminidase [Bacteroidales bacterium]
MKRLLFLAICIVAVGCSNINNNSATISCIVPQPKESVLNEGEFPVSGVEIILDTRMDEMSMAAIGRFSEKLSRAAGTPSALAITQPKKGAINFIVNESLSPEEYTLDVTQKMVKVQASSLNGFCYAVQSIMQLLPAAIYGSEAAPLEHWALPCCEIKDSPAFAYRGMHLDVVRHFFPIEEVKKYIDVLEMFKLNRFHWHLSDDQGWRVEIKALPELVEKGSWRRGSVIGHINDNNGDDNVPVSGYYTQNEIRQVVAYAAERGITVIPEIDLPGHMLAALTAYPNLGCSGGPYEVWTKWGVSPQVLCAGNEDTYKFLETVLGEICDLFPSEYIHIGGDECPKDEWKTCPKCQAKIKELGYSDTENFTAEQYLQTYVTKRMQKFLASRGRKLIGWEEILEGDLESGAVIMSWIGSGVSGQKAAGKGFDVIMTPYSHLYFDFYQAENTENEPLAIGGCTPVEKVYGYDPYEGIDEKNKSHIRGVQANLWTEYIPTCEHLEYMLLPRLLALSEVQWACDNRNWERFRQNLIEHEFAVLDAAGYNYRKTIK